MLLSNFPYAVSSSVSIVRTCINSNFIQCSNLNLTKCWKTVNQKLVEQEKIVDVSAFYGKNYAHLPEKSQFDKPARSVCSGRVCVAHLRATVQNRSIAPAAVHCKTCALVYDAGIKYFCGCLRPHQEGSTNHEKQKVVQRAFSVPHHDHAAVHFRLCS